MWSRHSFYWCAVSISTCCRARTARLPFQCQARAVSFGPTNYKECLHRSEWLSEWVSEWVSDTFAYRSLHNKLRFNASRYHSFKNDDKTVNSVQDPMEASLKWIRTRTLKQKWQASTIMRFFSLYSEKNFIWYLNHCTDFTQGGEASFWASKNYTRQVDFQTHSPNGECCQYLVSNTVHGCLKN